MAVTLPRFPHPVNEISARLVAAGVVTETVLTLAVGVPWWLVAAIAYGFVARVAAGPALSPLGLLVTRQITPRLALEPRYVAGATTPSRRVACVCPRTRGERPAHEPDRRGPPQPCDAGRRGKGRVAAAAGAGRRAPAGPRPDARLRRVRRRVPLRSRRAVDA